MCTPFVLHYSKEIHLKQTIRFAQTSFGTLNSGNQINGNDVCVFAQDRTS